MIAYMNKLDYEAKLQGLRKEWKENPHKKKIILRRVKALKYSQEPYKDKTTSETERLVADTIDSLF